MTTVNDPTADDFHMQVSSRDSTVLATKLAAWLPSVIPSQAPPVITAAGASEANGMSSETIAVQASWPDDDLPDARWILRMAPAANDVPVFRQYRLDHQYEVIRLVGELTDVPVPKVVALEPTGDVLGAPFFIMEECSGIVPPDVLPYTCGNNWLFDAPREQQRALQDSTIKAIAGIHSIADAPTTCGFLNETLPSGDTALRRHLDWFVDWYEFAAGDLGRSPLIERSIAWLGDNFPDDVAAAEPVVTWGDARIGNVMYDDFAPVAVLDWEMARVGPRETDVAWVIFAHMVFEEIAQMLQMPGMPHLFREEDVRETYRELTGVEVGDLRWFYIFAALQWCVVFMRTGARRIHFGEMEAPKDMEAELFYHRPLLERLLSEES